MIFITGDYRIRAQFRHRDILNNLVYRKKDGISLITRYKDSLLYGLLTVSDALNIAKSVASKLSSM